ncbi:hypothetical protein S7711_07498 [Stachybotrys chartarum IBT 7711]|uniref:Uncharacterized protein n=1 Tax=Stachybotrys chartarum (strain CBS 109288 / IBT 7711) TaxID=1280523 RepID=A0A084B7E5_STACB|nr:hypothetical protein S7711_07498 [Stachybotrys chartarum IBT 7711]
MSIGVGVGDFIKIIELVTQARKRFVDAPSEYNGISNEYVKVALALHIPTDPYLTGSLKNFSTVVQNIEVLLSGCEPQPEQLANLQTIRDDSIRLLNDFLERLNQDREIGVRSPSMTQSVKKAWKRFNWNPDDVQDFRRRISLNLSLLNAVEGQLSRIQQDVNHLTEQSNVEKRHEILQWIGTVEHGSRHSEIFDEHENGTGEWFLRSEEFRKWTETKGAVLFCPGLPGAGKTFMASIVVQHLQDLFEDKSAVGIAYHYCDFRHQDNENSSMILASILKQLAQCLDSLPQSLSTLYDKHKEKGTRPSFRETTSTLKSVASLLSRVFIVIDGLDECLVWREILAQIRGLQGANALVTSRAIPEIADDKELEGSSVLEIRASDADVREYLNRKMSIMESIGGMFLLARLHLDSLMGKMSIKTLKNALAALPTGSSAYDGAYLAAMERIERQSTEKEELAKDVLAWLTFAKRPLKVAELRAAVVVQESDSKLEQDSLVDIEDMVSVCAGLITVDKQSQTVILIHYTTQEYLERTRQDWRPDADAAIASSCFTYLLFPVFDVEFPEVDELSRGQKADRQQIPLLNYSVEHGPLHACLAISEPSPVARFFLSESRMPRNLLLLAAKHGGAQAEATAEWLLERGVCTDIWDLDRKTPLHYAVLNGWKRCVRLLLQRGACLDTDVDNMTPFHYAVKNEAEEISQVFINTGTLVDTPLTRETYSLVSQKDRVVDVKKDGAQNPIRDGCIEKGLTGLHFAVLTGSQQMTKFWLDHGANPNFPSDHDETPLHLALRRDLYDPKWPGPVDFWNDPKARIEAEFDFLDEDDSEDEWLSTQAWICGVRSAIISLLLEHPQVDVNAQDVFGISSLHIAARDADSSGSMIRTLIDKGAKISARTKKAETPLHLASRYGSVDAVNTLLAYGADPMAGDVDGLNALHCAAKQMHLEMMQSVVNHVPDKSLETFLKSKDKHEENVLHHLLSNTVDVNISVVNYVLKWPVGINDVNDAGMSPMAKYFRAFVLYGGDDAPEVLHLMFKCGANPAFETEEGLGLAHLAAGSRRVSVRLLRTLTSWGVDLKAEDKQGRTALHHSAIKGILTEDVLGFLCNEFGLSTELQDAHGKTPLDYAVELGQSHRHPDFFDSNRWARTEGMLRGLERKT